MSDRRGRLPGLDVLRGVAIALVLLRHAWPQALPGAGVVGVTIFFALSGYLITGLITDEVQRTGRFSYRRFYRNRALRLLPALLLVLTVFAAVTLTLDPLHERRAVAPTIVVGLLYLADAPGVPISHALTHLWTLAVEEQFYLVWPTLLIAAWWRRRVAALLVAGVLVSLAGCAIGLAVLRPTALSYTLPTSWAPALLAGAALRVFGGNLTAPRWLPWLGAAALAGMCLVSDAKSQPLVYLIGAPLIGAATATLILRARQVAVLPWAVRPLRALGVVSYGAYLWNYPVVVVMQRGTGRPLSSVEAVTSIAVTLLTAVASWRLVELPALRFKDRLSAGARQVHPGQAAEVHLPDVRLPSGTGTGSGQRSQVRSRT